LSAKSLFLPHSLDKLPYDKPFVLNIPTYEGSGQAVHPDIYVNSGSGPEYILSFTPYPFSYDKFENPSILVSSDGLRFDEEYPGINPLVPVPEKDHNDDPDLFFYEDRWNIVYLETLRPQKQNMVLLSSADRRLWDSRIMHTFYLEKGDPMIVSPSFIQILKQPYFFYVNISESINTIEYVQIGSPVSPCTEHVEWPGVRSPPGINDDLNPDFNRRLKCPIDLAGLNPWHVDVFFHGDFYYMTICCVKESRDSHNKSYSLYIARSKDNKAWELSPKAVMQNSYRASGFILHDDIFIYFSRAVGIFEVWETGIMRCRLDKFFGLGQ
jgi:hypothetical protein